MISGERAMLHKLISVCCSSGVKPVSRVPIFRRPSGSISASGQPVRPFIAPFQLARRVNCALSIAQSSQKSSEIRHICACRLAWAARDTGVSPGDMLSTIGRPERVMAVAMASISGAWAS
jgi:hypothetical protein